MTRYRLSEVWEVDADSEDGAWVALSWGMADKMDADCEIVGPSPLPCGCPDNSRITAPFPQVHMLRCPIGDDVLHGAVPACFRCFCPGQPDHHDTGCPLSLGPRAGVDCAAPKDTTNHVIVTNRTSGDSVV
jgi:hypothetical protein